MLSGASLTRSLEQVSEDDLMEDFLSAVSAASIATLVHLLEREHRHSRKSPQMTL